MKRSRLISSLFLLFVFGFGDTPSVHADRFTVGEGYTGWTLKPAVKIIGPANRRYTITWRNALGVVTGTANVCSEANITIVKAPAGTTSCHTVTAVDNSTPPCTDSATYAAIWIPPANMAIAMHNVQGGTVTALGQTFDLSGQFSVTALTIDRNPMSMTFGTLTGFVDAANVHIMGTSQTTSDFFELTLDKDQPYEVDMSGVLKSEDIKGLSSEFSVPLSGLITINGTDMVPFTGMAMGTSFYEADTDSPEMYVASLQLNTPLGSFNGDFISTGTIQLVDNPNLVPGDMNFDGVVNLFDIQPFVLGLSDPEAYQTQFGVPPAVNGDLNDDGFFNLLDIQLFINVLTGG